jgi:mannose-6-phosphate isomerase-like protein (cupin superfamily)
MGKHGSDDDIPLGQRKEKPWGYERPIAEFQGIHLKELFLRQGTISSLHYHEEKDEFFYIVKGQVQVLLADKKILLRAGDTLRIPPGQQHRIQPLEDTLILELGTKMFGDVVRIADEYNRAERE